MAMDTIPLAMPDDLLQEVRRTAEATHLSNADVMRQAIKAGLPQVREALSVNESLTERRQPLSEAECEAIWGKGSDKEHDAFVAHCAGLPAGSPPE